MQTELWFGPNFVAPDKIAPEIGWRLWRARPNRAGVYRLFSLNEVFEWTAGKRVEAQCHARHAAPFWGHTCGIYAHKEKQAVAREALARGPILGLIVFGQVSLWGRTVERSRGWRAQYAYPYGLTVVFFGWYDWWRPARERRPGIARDLRDAYGVEFAAVGREEFIAVHLDLEGS